MNFGCKIDKRNEQFYREAYRARSLEELNESAGIKILLRDEIEDLYRYACEEFKQTLEIGIREDYDGFILTLEEKK